MGILDVRAKLLVEKIMANGGNMSRAQRELGHSEAYIKSNKLKTTKTFQKAMKTEIDLIKEKKQILIEALTKEKAEKESASRLSGAIKDLNHVEQLLRGKATDAIRYVIEEEES